MYLHGKQVLCLVLVLIYIHTLGMRAAKGLASLRRLAWSSGCLTANDSFKHMCWHNKQVLYFVWVLIYFQNLGMQAAKGLMSPGICAGSS